MKLATSSIALAVIALSGNVACSGASEVVAGNRHRPTAGEQVGDVAPALAVAIQGLAKSTSGAPLGGVSICLEAGPAVDVSTSVCTTSSEDGTWMLSGVPEEMDLSLTIEKEGFVPALWPISTGTGDMVLSPDDGVLMRAADLAAPMTKGAGQIRFSARLPADGTLDGVDVTVVSLDDPAAPAGVVAARTTAAGPGVVAGVPAGLYLLTYNAMACRSADQVHGYSLARFDDLDAAHIVVPVIDGHVTMPVGMDCSGL